MVRTKVSFVRESRPGEIRPLLLPEDIAQFARVDADVFIESGFGEKLGFCDREYATALPAARFVDRHTAWSQADLVLKFKRPSCVELQMMKRGATIAAMFHAEDAPELVRCLLERDLRAYSYEYFCDRKGRHPLMRATGEIAGKQAVLYAGYHLQSHLGGSGRLLASCSSAGRATVSVLGFGTVGRASAHLSRALGAQTHVFRWSNSAGAIEPHRTQSGLIWHAWNKDEAAKVIAKSDVVIGALRISTFDTPPFITRDMVKRMRPGSVIVDVTAGYGSGYIETSTQVGNLADPFVLVEGVKHIKLRELPLGVALTSAEQISTQFAPHLVRFSAALAAGREWATALPARITANGQITNEFVRRHHPELCGG